MSPAYFVIGGAVVLGLCVAAVVAPPALEKFEDWVADRRERRKLRQKQKEDNFYRRQMVRIAVEDVPYKVRASAIPGQGLNARDRVERDGLRQRTARPPAYSLKAESRRSSSDSLKTAPLLSPSRSPTLAPASTAHTPLADDWDNFELGDATESEFELISPRESAEFATRGPLLQS